MTAPMLHIGASKETVETITGCIIAILSVRADEATKIVALEVLKQGATVNNVAISDCTFTSKGTS